LSGVPASVACIQRLVRNATETLVEEGLGLQAWWLWCHVHLQGKIMIIDLAGKHAVVTGSTSGIGFAIARGLAEAGAAVVLNGRTEKSVDAAIKRLAQHVPQVKVEGVAADLAAAAGVAAFAKRVGETDILVNNLGIFEPKPFADITDEDWHRFFQTNVMSGVRLSRHYLSSMASRGWGRIVFISSESALNIPVEMIHYGMTKTAQLAIARGLAQSVAGTGVTVNAVLPGPTRSEGVLDFFANLAREQGLSEQEMERRFIAEHRPTSLIRRLAAVEEVANMVVFVCSLQASATTGAALRVDGGVVQSIA
jgi:NAD(P)-dependent dehydrogenase (short-subunit alcohol dehydrogenase family)